MRTLIIGILFVLLATTGCASETAPVSPNNTASATETPASNTAEAPTATTVPAQSPTPEPTSTPVPTPTFSPGRVILPTVAIPTATQTSVPEDPVSEELDQIGVRTAVLRELFALRTVERETIDSEELNSYLVENLEDDRETLAKSELLYKTLGILEPDDDLYEILLSLLSENVLGFFESEEDKLYVVQNSDEFTAIGRFTYVHEYTHGLQQQHFDIHSTREALKESGDASRAFQALVEGDATLVQTIYLFNNMTQSEQEEIINDAQSGEDQEVFRSAPHVIQRELVFPYNEGFFFNFALFQFAENDWDIVNNAYEELPKSTEQILHPEKYIQQEEPVEVGLPDISESLGESWEQIEQDTLGEFFIQVYLETNVAIEEAEAAATGWGGDTYSLLSGSGEEIVVISKVTWDTEDDALEFFDTFQSFMGTMSGQEWQASEDGEAHLITNGEQSVSLNIDLLDTLVVFAPDPETLLASQAALE